MRGSASSVLTATELINRKGQILTPWGQNQHPSTDNQNFVTVEYVDEPYICAKFGANSSHGKLLWKWVKYMCKELFIYLFTYLFIYIFFRKLNYLPTGQSRGPIFALDGSNDVKSCKDMPCWLLLELQPEWDMGRFFETQPSSKFLYPAQPMEAFTWSSPTITDTRQLKKLS